MKKILVVDDERDILDEISETLTDEGYEAICVGAAASGEEALNLIRGVFL